MSRKELGKLVVVLGMHRSGTSVIIRSLQTLGIELGNNIFSARPYNPKGFFEDKSCLGFNEALLGHYQSNYHQFNFNWVNCRQDSFVENIKEQAIEYLRTQKTKYNIWGFKDPRTCRLLPFWQELFELVEYDVSYIVVIRNPMSVAESLLKRDQFLYEKSYFLWLQDMLCAINGALKRCCVVVDYDLMMDNPTKELSRIAKQLSLSMPLASDPVLQAFCNEFLDAKLRHTRFTLEMLEQDSRVPKDVLVLYRLLERIARDELTLDSAEVISTIEKLSERINAFSPIFEYAGQLERKNLEICASMEKAESALSELQLKVAELTKHAAQFEESNLQLQEGNAQLELEICAVNLDKGRLNLELDKLRQIVSDKDYLVQLRDQELLELRKQIETTYMTVSWKLTAPIRYIRHEFMKDLNNFFRHCLSGCSRWLWSLIPLSKWQKRRIKRFLFNNFSILFGWSLAYRDWCEEKKIEAILSNNENMFVPRLAAPPIENTPVQLICFYLPQFHAIPENDEWWGEGFTEWTNVQPAQPQFEGHYQPHKPIELGYYNLLDSEVQQKQIELAKLYGVGGFCFYFYWFNGKRLLEQPTLNYLENKSLDFPFCLCWANENWSRRWDGCDEDILIPQSHSAEDDIDFIQYISKYLLDSRYIKVDNKPLLIVYRPNLLPDMLETSQRWRDWCRQNGVGEIYLAYTQSMEEAPPASYGFDAAIEFPPNLIPSTNITNRVAPLSKSFSGYVNTWEVFLKKSRQYTKKDYVLFRSVCPSWDNTPRRGEKSRIFLSSPKIYRQWLDNAVRYTTKHHSEQERLIFINAWNEWAEGAHLEPDEKYGYAWLQATRDALLEHKVKKKIVYVTHDCALHGAQLLSLAIVKQLLNLGISVQIIALSGGDLEERFSAISPLFVLDKEGGEALLALVNNLKVEDYQHALTSTVVSGSLVEILSQQGYKILSLIHELPGIISEMKCEERANAIATYSDKVVFPAEFVKRRFLSLFPIEQEKIIVRAQGLTRKNVYRNTKQDAYEEICQRHHLPRGTKIILTTGYLDSRKGGDFLINIAGNVLKKRNDIVFVWLGNSAIDFKDKLNERIKEFGIEGKILFVNFVSDPSLYYAAASVYALTSREDPFPSVVLEASEVGVPVVAFDKTTGAQDYIVKYGGRIAKAFNIDDFSDSILELLREDVVIRNVDQKDLSIKRYVQDLTWHLCGRKRISVIVPNYNYAHLIEQRLDSICNQSYPIYELIILDDASTDNSVAVISDYLQSRSIEATFIKNEENSGSVFKQWAKGVALATGDIVWIAEADDLSEIDFINTLVTTFQQDDLVLAFCQSKCINHHGSVISDNYLQYTDDVSDKWRKNYVLDGLSEIREALSIKNTIPNVSAVLFERKALVKTIDELGNLLFDFKVAGDYLLYLHILTKGKISYFSQSLNAHRRHEDSSTRSVTMKSHIEEILRVQNVAHKLSSPTDEIKYAAKNYINRLCQEYDVKRPTLKEYKRETELMLATVDSV